MSSDSLENGKVAVIPDNAPLVSYVELGVAALNSVSHHEHLRCAKLVNPFIQKLTLQGETSPGILGNSNLIVIEPCEPTNTNNDVYEDIMENELESSFDTSFEIVDKPGTLGNDDSDSTLGCDSDKERENLVDSLEVGDRDTAISDCVEVQVTVDDKVEKVSISDKIEIEAKKSSMDRNNSPGADRDEVWSLTSPEKQSISDEKDLLTEVFEVFENRRIEIEKEELEQREKDIENDEENIEDSTVIIKKINKRNVTCSSDEEENCYDKKDENIIDADVVEVEYVMKEETKEVQCNVEVSQYENQNEFEQDEVYAEGYDESVHDKDIGEDNIPTQEEFGSFGTNESNKHNIEVEGEDISYIVENEHTEFVQISECDNEMEYKESESENSDGNEDMDRNIYEGNNYNSEDGHEEEDVQSDSENVVTAEAEDSGYVNEDFIDSEEAETKPAEPVAEPDTKDVQQAEENAAKFNSNSEPKENGLTEEEAVHFAEMNNVRTMFESGKAPAREETPKKTSVKDEYDEGGEYESTPVTNPDVVKESDQGTEDLPEAGTAKNLLNKFKSIQEEKAAPVAAARRASPPKEVGKVEYSNEPAERLEQYQGKSEEGVFESNPQTHEDVVRSGDYLDDVVPEKGSAKNILNKFKEIQSGAGQQKVKEPKREITPDRSGKVEYVSEPRGQNIVYDENKGDEGVFESTPKYEEGVVRCGEASEEVLPESGTAKSLLSKFKQMESEVKNRPPPSPKREITPDRSGKVEYVSEPRGFLEKYEPQTEAGVYENQPADREVVRCGEATEEVLPESGTAKRTLEKFKEIQKQSSSPVSPSGRSKEFTPPRESSPGRTVAGVVENTPVTPQDVVRSGDIVDDQLPEQGSAKNILNKFKEIQSGSSGPSSPSRKPKEFTPPPESGVYENKPDEHIVIESNQTFSGVLESTPSKSTADVPVNRDQQTPETEIPESGMAKNLVSKFRQLETSAKTSKSASPKFKEFTPPRDSRGPLSPKSPAGAATNGVHPSDLPGQYQQQNSATIYENEPEKKEGVYREADTDWEEGLPAPNTTSSMLQRFRNIQQQAEEDKKTPAPISKKDDTSQSPSLQDHEAKGMFKVVQTEKCAACQKTVYAMEKLEMNGHIYHRNCFKCSHCSARLTPKTFSMNEGVIFCTTHFKQLFARKGNYDEGFGRQQYKKKWGEKAEGTSA